MSYAEYLLAEERSDVKHAFADGEMFAMAGGTRKHAAVQTRLVVALGNALAGRQCVPYGSELRIYLPHLHEGCYADALVICGRFGSDPIDPDATTNPTAIFEVLSPTTEAYDRGRKFAKYRGLESLREFVLLAQDSASIELFRREPGGTWQMHTWGPGERVVLASLDIAIDVDQVYLAIFDEGP